MKRVSVVTINFNQDKITEELLDSIAETNTYENMEVIVVDNGSTVNPLPKWVAKYPDVKFIRSEVNLGFSGGNNIGIAQADGDYYFLVNNKIYNDSCTCKRLVCFCIENFA
ncbi:MAG: glycosyltransferase, partial [Sphingobacteriales bacterium]